MRNDIFLEVLEENKDFKFKFKAFIQVPISELKTRSYRYPFDVFELEINSVLGSTINFKLIKGDVKCISYTELKKLAIDFKNQATIKCNILFTEEFKKEYCIAENSEFTIDNYDIGYSEKEVVFQVEKY